MVLPTPGSAQAELLGAMCLLAVNVTQRMDELLAPLGLTSRQMLLLNVLQRDFPGGAPSLSEAAAAYGSSRQNVKRLAEQLARRGYLDLVQDETDRRPLRLRPTAKVDLLRTVPTNGPWHEMLGGADDEAVARLLTLTRGWLGHLTPPTAAGTTSA